MQKIHVQIFKKIIFHTHSGMQKLKINIEWSIEKLHPDPLQSIHIYSPNRGLDRLVWRGWLWEIEDTGKRKKEEKVSESEGEQVGYYRSEGWQDVGVTGKGSAER